MSAELRRSDRGLALVAVAAAALFVLVDLLAPYIYFVVDAPRYLTVHTLLELGSILVSSSVFIVNWEATKQGRNAHSLFVATGFLTVAAVDTMHTLSFDGMPDFVTANSVSKAIYYWLYARLWAGAVLWLAAYVRPDASGWYLRRSFLFGVNLLACALPFVVVTLFQNMLPAVYVDGTGPTQIKVLAEYAVVALNLGALIAHLRVFRAKRDEAVILMMAALVVAVFGELDFTFYLTTYDVYNLLGHVYKVAAYYLLFRSLLVTSVQRPYRDLSVAKEHLEKTVSQLDARNQELDAQYDLAVTLSGILRPAEMLQSAVDKVVKVLQADTGAVFLADEEPGLVKLVAWKGLDDDLVARHFSLPFLLPKGMMAVGGGKSQPTALEDRALVRTLAGTTGRVGALGSCACAPIVSKGEVVGMIGVTPSLRRTFSSGDVDLLTAIGHELGLAIENARLYERTDERLREKVAELQVAERRSRLLVEVGELFGSTMEMEKVLELVARKSAEVLGDWCFIYLLDERDGMLRLVAVHHGDPELKRIKPLLARRPIKVGETLVGRVAASGQPVLEASLSKEQIAAEVQELAQSVDDLAALRVIMPVSVVAAPVRARGRTLGVLLSLATHSQQRFGEAELSLAVELADRAGTAIDNSRLFGENLAQRRHLEAIFSQMVDGVVIADESGAVLEVNAAARAMLGEHLELVVASRRHGDRGNGDGERSLMVRALAGESIIGEEVLLGASVGDPVLSASASPVRDDHGEIKGAVVVLRDVTAEREVERVKDEFVATVSHELRTPITAVLGYTDMLLRGLRGPLGVKQTESLEAVRSAGHRLLALINDLLDISRLEARKQELLIEPLPLHLATDRTIGAVAVLASSKDISLVRDVPEDLPPVLADAEQLQRILGNLLSNAIKFTSEGGTVTVSACLGDGYGRSGNPSGMCYGELVTVTVADTGIGVPVEHQEKIWEKFHQVDSSPRRLYGGTGLGLAIVKGLVELHGGHVWVRSAGVPGDGSIFGFTLPVGTAVS